LNKVEFIELIPPLMQTQPALVFGLKGEQDLFAILSPDSFSGRQFSAVGYFAFHCKNRVSS
jgi:hypothetical protein